MAGGSVTFEFDQSTFDAIDKQLARLDDFGLRTRTLERGLIKAGNITKKRLKEILPKPGYPGDKPELKPLRDTIQTKLTRTKDGKRLTVSVGAEYKPSGGGGNHMHIVELGHDITNKRGKRDMSTANAANASVGKKAKGPVLGFVQGRFYIAKAAAETESQVGAELINAITNMVDEALK